MHHGLERMVERQDDVYFYITLMNENYPHPAHARGRRARDHQGHVPAAVDRQSAREEAARPAARHRHDPARGDRGGRAARAGLGRRRRRLELPELQPAGAATARRWSAGTCCIRPRRRAWPTSTQCLEEHGRAGGRGDRLHAACRRADPRLHAAGGYVVLGTDGFGRSDIREQLRGTSRSTATTSRWRR